MLALDADMVCWLTVRSSLISLLLAERGWKEWPCEDWFVSQAGEMLCRPKDARQVAFCNCASYSTVVVDVPGSDHAYDRLMLADICGHNAPNPEAYICPPSYKIKNGGLVDEPAAIGKDEDEDEGEGEGEGAAVGAIDELWNGERPSMWFLKENSRNYGQGIDITPTAEEALAIAAKNEADEPGAGREYVLQPHIINPLLYLDKHKFHIRVYALIMLSPCNRYPRNFAHISGKMPISPEIWSPDSTDKTVQITTARTDLKYENWEHYDHVHPKLLDATAVLLEQIEPKLGPQAWAGRAAFELLGLDYMVDKDFKPYLLEANTGPVLKVEHDMEIITGLTNMIFGTADKPLEGMLKGSGPASHGWVELNNQKSTPERRATQLRKLVRWMTERTRDPECALCLDEELVKHCAEELTEFAKEDEYALEAAGETDSAGENGPSLSSSLIAVVDAGAVEACLSVLEDTEIEPSAKVHAIALLAELFDYDEVIDQYVSVEMIELLLPHMDCTANDELQAMATSVVTNLVDVLEEPLPSEVRGVLMGTVLWQLDSPNLLIAECAAACIAVLCSDSTDGLSCSTTAIRLGGVPRLRRLAGLNEETGEDLPPHEQGPDDPERVTSVALDALEAIALAETAMMQFEEAQTKKLEAQEEQVYADAGKAGGAQGGRGGSGAKLPATCTGAAGGGAASVAGPSEREEDEEKGGGGKTAGGTDDGAAAGDDDGSSTSPTAD
jgi:hypothetical protein